VTSAATEFLDWFLGEICIRCRHAAGKFELRDILADSLSHVGCYAEP
jgi:hypothetical protein